MRLPGADLGARADVGAPVFAKGRMDLVVIGDEKSVEARTFVPAAAGGEVKVAQGRLLDIARGVGVAVVVDDDVIRPDPRDGEHRPVPECAGYHKRAEQREGEREQ